MDAFFLLLGSRGYMPAQLLGIAHDAEIDSSHLCRYIDAGSLVMTLEAYVLLGSWEKSALLSRIEAIRHLHTW